jgi:hypothetical protein
VLKEIDNNTLESIVGGSETISSSMISSLTNVIKFIYEVGTGVGSAMRRLFDKDMCPTK